jgi:hypothetical protein
MNFRRIISNKGTWIPQIDGLRFIAIMGVLCGHTLGELINGHGGYHQQPPLTGWVAMTSHLGRGVELFFMISGFILARPFIRGRLQGGNPISLKAFYLRRVTRLEPPYILSLVIYAVANLVIMGSNRTHISGYLCSLAWGTFTTSSPKFPRSTRHMVPRGGDTILFDRAYPGRSLLYPSHHAPSSHSRRRHYGECARVVCLGGQGRLRSPGEYMLFFGWLSPGRYRSA